MSLLGELLLVAALAAPTSAGEPKGCHARAAIETRPVSETAAERLRGLPGTTRGGRFGEYLLSDGRILVQNAAGEPGALYHPEAFKRYRRALDEEQRFRRIGAGASFHVLRGLIEDGGEFAARAPRLAADLARRLVGEPPSPTGGDALMALAARWRGANCRIDPTVFRELTAELGERLRGRIGGHWTTRLGEDGVVEPVIELVVDGQTRRIAPWLWVPQLLDRGADLRALIDEALAAPLAPKQAAPRRAPTSPTHAPTRLPSPNRSPAEAAPTDGDQADAG